MPGEKRIAIIGAGVGGLSAAAILSRHFQVDVFDKGPAPGGKMRQIEVEGARIDSGPTVFTMDWAFDEVFELAGARLRDRVNLSKLDVLARHYWTDGSTFDLHADLHRSAQAISDFAGAQAASNYLDFCEKSKRVFNTLLEPFMRQSQPSFSGLVKARSPFSLMQTAPFSSLWSVLGKSFQDPRLRQLFGRYATYCGASPFEAPATLMLIAHVEQVGVWALDGGMQALANALHDVAIENGARFQFDVEVDEIQSDAGRVSGVRLTDGQVYDADIVVMNGDVAALAAGLLGEAPSHAVGGLQNVQRSQSAMTWSGVSETSGAELSMHTVCFSDDYAAEFDAVFKQGRPPNEPTVYICAQDRAPGLRRSGVERVFCLINAPADGDTKTYTEAEIRSWRTATLAQLDRCGVQIESRLENAVATTPTTFARMFPQTGGALYGMASHGWRASFQRSGVRTRVPGLYLAGGSVHPGPGAPMAALSGKASAEAILADCASTSTSRPAAIPGGT